jgi:hypothetical protein
VKQELPAISKLAIRVACAIEDAVANRFAAKFRRNAGEDLRQAARNVVRCAEWAWRERNAKLEAVEALSRAVDDLKIEIRIADGVKAWGSIKEMEAVSRLVHDLGRQVGGWLRRLQQPMDQNAAAACQSQRVPILSSRSAPQGANP